MFVKIFIEDLIDHAMVKSINEIEQVKGMLKEISVNYGQGFSLGKSTSFTQPVSGGDNINK